MQSRIDTKRLVEMGIIGALALALSAIETVFMINIPLFPPGAKPGLANVVVMFTACTFGAGATVYIIVLKSLFVLLTRGASAFLMSLAGGVISGIAVVFLLRMRLKSVGYIGISVLGAVLHNAAQLFMSMLITKTTGLIYYLPLLMICGIVSGLITGLIVAIVLPRIQKVLKEQKVC